MLKYIFQNILFKYSSFVFVLSFFLFSFLFFYSTKLQIDASASSLLLEDDKNLVFSRLMAKRFDDKNILILTYSPKDDLLSSNSLRDIKIISKKLRALELSKEVYSIVNAPLFESPILGFSDLLKGFNTINDNPNIDKALVKKELLNSPLYKNNLVSNDFKTTAILIHIKNDKKFLELLEKKKNINKINIKKVIEIEKDFLEHKKIRREQISKNIKHKRNYKATQS